MEGACGIRCAWHHAFQGRRVSYPPHPLFALRGEADEVVIIRNGLLTDTSYSNIALFDGRHWVTPRQPLLRGTMRQSLLDAGVLTEQDIKAEDWSSYRRVSLINAMMPLGRLVCKI